jgi:hypothetical protein
MKEQIYNCIQEFLQDSMLKEILSQSQGMPIETIVFQLQKKYTIKDERNELVDVSFDFQDFRINYFTLSGFRKIPENSLPFGLNLLNCPKEKNIPAKNCFTVKGFLSSNVTQDTLPPPQSLFLVGENGSGKSSLFDALEYNFTDDIGEVHFRKYPKKERFIAHKDNGSHQYKIEVYTEHCYKKNLNLQVFFCSENDLDEIGKLEMNIVWLHEEQKGEDKVPYKLDGLSQYMVEAIGLQDFLKLNNALKEREKQVTEELKQIGDRIANDSKWQNSLTKFDLKNLNNIDSIRQAQDKLNFLLKYVKKYKYQKFDILKYLRYFKRMRHDKYPAFNKRFKKIFKEDIENKVFTEKQLINILIYVFQIMNNHQTELLDDDNIEKYSKELEKIIENIKEFDKGKQDQIKYNSTLKCVNDYQNLLVEKLKQLMKDYIPVELVEKIMNYFQEGEEVFKAIWRSDGSLYFCVELPEQNNRKPIRISPKKYYNTFRYELFCLALKVSLAFAYKEIENINFPLIWDDIFFAADYDRRMLVTKFMEAIHHVHDDKFFPDKSLPTDIRKQLQIICFTHDEILIDAVREYYRKKNPSVMPIFGRLFDYEEMKNKETLVKYGETDFYNLYHEFYTY